MTKRIVIKLGGLALSQASTLRELAHAVSDFRARHHEVIVVHGGGPAINEELKRRGIEWQFVRGQRQTTVEMIDVIDQVLAREVNGRIVESLRGSGMKARGLSGATDGILLCSQADPELGWVGQVERVGTSAIETALARGEVPVIAPIGFGDGMSKFNVNADWAASRIAARLKAEQLVFLTDQDGILGAGKRFLPEATPRELKVLIAKGVISGGMSTKALAMIAALEKGVREVRVLNAGAASLLTLTDIGTRLMKTKTQRELYGQPG